MGRPPISDERKDKVIDLLFRGHTAREVALIVGLDPVTVRRIRNDSWLSYWDDKLLLEEGERTRMMILNPKTRHRHRRVGSNAVVFL